MGFLEPVSLLLTESSTTSLFSTRSSFSRAGRRCCKETKQDTDKMTLFCHPLPAVGYWALLKLQTVLKTIFSLYENLWQCVPQSHFALYGNAAVSQLSIDCLLENHLVLVLAWAPEVQFLILVTNTLWLSHLLKLLGTKHSLCHVEWRRS